MKLVKDWKKILEENEMSKGSTRRRAKIKRAEMDLREALWRCKEESLKIRIMEELKKVQDSVNNLNRSQLEIRSMEVKKHELMHQVAGLRDELTVLQGEFEKEYGTFDINIQDGAINYPKENGEVNS